MNNWSRVLARYIGSAIFIALSILAINIFLLVTFIIQTHKNDIGGIETISEAISCEKRQCAINPDAKIMKKDQLAWAMLLDQRGNILWEKNLPSEFQKEYTVSDIARATQWYMGDYPIRVIIQEDGLLVWAFPKHSMWKYNIEMPIVTMQNIFQWLPAMLILNIIVAFLMSLFFGVLFLKKVKPITIAVADIAENKPIQLKEKGEFRELAQHLNTTSRVLQQQEQEIKKRDRARADWIAGISHDIRTPLSIIMGYAGQLAEDTMIDAAERAKTNVILKQSEKIKRLIADLTLATRLEYDMQPLRQSTISLPVLLREIVADYLNQEWTDQWEFSLHIPSTKPFPFMGDRALITRAISNLINNSIQHSNGNQIEIRLREKDKTYLLSITDNGKGFTPEFLAHTANGYAHFYNKDNKPKAISGLALVHKIIVAHGGELQLKNLSSGGADAAILLPIHQSKTIRCS